jgi:flagellar protein FliT
MTELPLAESPLRYYEALETASKDMLEAAREGDWNRVARLEAACALVIGKLRQIAHLNQLSENGRQSKLRILKSILANDAEIRRITEALPEQFEAALAPASEYRRMLH